MKDELRDHLLSLLEGGNAHMTFAEAVADFPESHFNTFFPQGTYTPWHLLEHLRRTQADILDFMTNSDYKEPEWPKDYWPAIDERASGEDWERTIKEFQKDEEALKEIIRNKQTNFFARIPHGSGQTVLREILLVADHNAYHIGEFAIMRQVTSTWPKDRKRA